MLVLQGLHASLSRWGLLMWVAEVAEGGLHSQEFVGSCPVHPGNQTLSLPLY